MLCLVGLKNVSLRSLCVGTHLQMSLQSLLSLFPLARPPSMFLQDCTDHQRSSAPVFVSFLSSNSSLLPFSSFCLTSSSKKATVSDQELTYSSLPTSASPLSGKPFPLPPSTLVEEPSLRVLSSLSSISSSPGTIRAAPSERLFGGNVFPML